MSINDDIAAINKLRTRLNQIGPLRSPVPNRSNADRLIELESLLGYFEKQKQRLDDAPNVEILSCDEKVSITWQRRGLGALLRGLRRDLNDVAERVRREAVKEGVARLLSTH